MIFNMSTAGGGKTPVYPQYTGTMNVVYLNEDATAGYAEFTSSGTLSWINNQLPEGVKFDLFCVGGGAGGAGSDTYTNYQGAGAGGGGGYTTIVKGIKLSEAVSIVIGAGGSGGSKGGLGTAGGTTSIGDLCVAVGGNPPSSRSVGGNGGSGGARCGLANQSGDKEAVFNAMRGGAGGSNGSNGTGGGYGTNGKGQGTPTTDLLGRVHAGGGDGWAGYSPTWGTGYAGNGGKSDFSAGSGGGYSATTGGKGGGGYGGGGCGAAPKTGDYVSPNTGYSGGQGFAMIGWGDYLALYEAQKGAA